MCFRWSASLLSVEGSSLRLSASLLNLQASLLRLSAGSLRSQAFALNCPANPRSEVGEGPVFQETIPRGRNTPWRAPAADRWPPLIRGHDLVERPRPRRLPPAPNSSECLRPDCSAARNRAAHKRATRSFRSAVAPATAFRARVAADTPSGAQLNAAGSLRRG